MKKVVGILLIIFSILFCMNGIEKEEAFAHNEIRTIYVEEGKRNISYYEEKYDIYNEEKKSFVMEESYEEKIGKTSTEEGYRIEFRVEVYKEEGFFTFGYKEYLEEETRENQVRIDVKEYGGEYYLISSNGCVTPYLEAIKEAGLEECVSFAFNPFEDTMGLSSDNTSTGNGSLSRTAGTAIGLTAGVAAAAAIASNLANQAPSYSSGGSSSSQSSERTYGSFGAVVRGNPDIKQKLKDLGKTEEDLNRCLAEFLGLSLATLEKFYKSDKKVLCIGRADEKTYGNANDLDGYQNYAKKNDFWAFFVADYKQALDDFTQGLVELANKVLVLYCCNNNWDFILVTNPYHYMAEHLDTTTTGGAGYAMEISIIREFGYRKFVDSTLTWSTIPNPGYSEESYYAYAGYRVSR